MAANSKIWVRTYFISFGSCSLDCEMDADSLFENFIIVRLLYRV